VKLFAADPDAISKLRADRNAFQAFDAKYIEDKIPGASHIAIALCEMFKE
jgi:hypothetical protein